MGYQLRPAAENDIYQIMSYIGRHNPRAALRWQTDIYDAFNLLADMPGLGSQRETRRTTVRMFPRDGYLIFYREQGSGIEVLRVLHAARDWPKLVR